MDEDLLCKVYSFVDSSLLSRGGVGFPATAAKDRLRQKELIVDVVQLQGPVSARRWGWAAA